MGIGPLNYGGAGSKQGVHGCGTPMKKIVETSGGATNRYKSMKDKRRKKDQRKDGGTGLNARDLELNRHLLSQDKKNNPEDYQ